MNRSSICREGDGCCIRVRVGLGSRTCLLHFFCSNLFISGIDYDMHREVFESLRVFFINAFCIGFI